MNFKVILYYFYSVIEKHPIKLLKEKMVQNCPEWSKCDEMSGLVNIYTLWTNLNMLSHEVHIEFILICFGLIEYIWM